MSELRNSEMRLAEYAENLATWFGQDREIPERFTGKLFIEPLYVKALVEKIQEEYQYLTLLTEGEANA